MKVTVLGGGPAGLFFAILMKKQDPAHEITVIERDGPDDTFGWGIVLSDRAVDNHIVNLRRKIEHDPARPEYIQTVYGVGYKFAEDEDVA